MSARCAKNSLFVRNLSPHISEAILRETFKHCDDIDNVLFRAYPNRANEFFAQLDFRTPKGVIEGKKLSGSPILGITCEVSVLDPCASAMMKELLEQNQPFLPQGFQAPVNTEPQGVQAEYIRKFREAAEDKRLRTVHIGGLQKGVTEDAVRILCANFGGVDAVRLDEDEKGMPFALVEFTERGPAHVCKLQQNFLVDGRTLAFTEAKTMIDTVAFAEKNVHFHAPIFDAATMKAVLAAQCHLNPKLKKARAAAAEIMGEPLPPEDEDEEEEEEKKEEEEERGLTAKEKDTDKKSDLKPDHQGADHRSVGADACRERPRRRRSSRHLEGNQGDHRDKRHHRRRRRGRERRRRAPGNSRSRSRRRRRQARKESAACQDEGEEMRTQEEADAIDLEEEVDLVPNTELFVLGNSSSYSEGSSLSPEPLLGEEDQDVEGECVVMFRSRAIPKGCKQASKNSETKVGQPQQDTSSPPKVGDDQLPDSTSGQDAGPLPQVSDDQLPDATSGQEADSPREDGAGPEASKDELRDATSRQDINASATTERKKDTPSDSLAVQHVNEDLVESAQSASHLELDSTSVTVKGSEPETFTRARGDGGKEEIDVPKQRWECVKCGEFNNPWRMRCNNCSAPGGMAEASSTSGSVPASPAESLVRIGGDDEPVPASPSSSRGVSPTPARNGAAASHAGSIASSPARSIAESPLRSVADSGSVRSVSESPCKEGGGTTENVVALSDEETEEGIENAARRKRKQRAKKRRKTAQSEAQADTAQEENSRQWVGEGADARARVFYGVTYACQA